MSNQGFDTWIVKVRGAGLSKRADEWKAIYDPLIKPVVSVANSVDEANQKGVMSIGEKMVGNSCSMSDPKSANVMSVGEKIVGNSGSMPDPKHTNVNGKMVDSFTWNEPKLVTELSDTFIRLAERLSGYLNEGQLRDISDKFFDQISKLLEDPW